MLGVLRLLTTLFPGPLAPHSDLLAMPVIFQGVLYSLWMSLKSFICRFHLNLGLAQASLRGMPGMPWATEQTTFRGLPTASAMSALSFARDEECPKTCP